MKKTGLEAAENVCFWGLTACFAGLADQFCCINAAKIIAAHTAWFGPKPFAWPWVWAMWVGGCCSRGEKITRVAVTLL